MSALPPKADIGRHLFNVRFVPIADIAALHSITPLPPYAADPGWRHINPADLAS